MPAPPSLAPFAGLLADLATDLRRTECCLVVCDKGWTLPMFAALKDRLRAVGVKCGYLDGRSTGDSADGTIPTAVAMMRYAVRTETDGAVVYALPHLDVMTTADGGWTPVSREVVALLYENPLTVWLGFQDPSLPLPDVVTKVFTRRYVIAEPYRELKPASEFPAIPVAPLPPLVPPPPPEDREPPPNDTGETDERVGLE